MWREGLEHLPSRTNCESCRDQSELFMVTLWCALSRVIVSVLTTYPGLEMEVNQKTTRVMLTQQCCFLCIVAIEGKQ
jgi:flagellar biosynthesis protein FliR